MSEKTFADFGIYVPSNSRNETDVTCPQCSPFRKKRNIKCLSVNISKGVWNCAHCGWFGGLSQGVERISTPAAEPVQVNEPPPNIPTYTISPNPDSFYEWFAARGISREVVDRYKITRGETYMAAVGSRTPVIRFPYYRGDEVVNIKFRDAEKHFQMVAGAERILYGINDCVDKDTVIVVEGEIDKLTFAEIGMYNAVSVPDGAPPPNARNYASKFEYLDKDDVAAMFGKAVRIILAVDNDDPGIKLRDELSRRFGREKCWLVTYPDGCKDINDVLVRHGKDAVRTVLESAVAYPVEGLIEVSDIEDAIDSIYDNGFSRGVSTGWRSLDNHYTVKTSYWTLVTGIPQHGKSEFVDALMVNLAREQDWKFGVYSPENYPFEYHFTKIAEKYVGKPFFAPDPMFSGTSERMNKDELNDAKDWVSSHFTFLGPEQPTLECVLDLAKVLILRKGIKGLVIDPWNMLEHDHDRRQSETDYIGECLTKITRFAAYHDIHIWVVAHPRILHPLADGTYPVPRPYDVSGSAHWANRPRFAIAVYRDVLDTNKPTEIHIQKVSLKHCGSVGVVPLRYERATGQYQEDARRAATSVQTTQYAGGMF
jgi:twinkle protein